MRWKVLCIGLLLLAPLGAQGQEIRITPRTTATFATLEEARSALGARDAFTAKMGSFDRGARMQTDRAVTEEEFCRHAASCALAWDAEDQRAVTEAFRPMLPRLGRFRLNLPPRVLLVLANGKEEAGNACYTRGDAIILHREQVVRTSAEFLGMHLAHGLFHLAMRRDPPMRARLFKILGFEMCDPIEIPGRLGARRATNPDALEADAFTTIPLLGKPTGIAPVVFEPMGFNRSRLPAGSEQWTVLRPNGMSYTISPVLTTYTLFRKSNWAGRLGDVLVVLEQAGGRWRPRTVDGEPVLAANGDYCNLTGASGWHWLAQPDEVLAYDFGLLVADPERPLNRIKEFNAIRRRRLIDSIKRFIGIKVVGSVRGDDLTPDELEMNRRHVIRQMEVIEKLGKALE